MEPAVRSLSLLLAFVTAAAWAADANVRSYALPGHGSLELQVPAPWEDRIERTPGVPPTLHFNAQAGAQFEVIVTPIGAPTPETKPPTKEEMKAGVRRGADQVARQAVETSIEVKELKGKHSSGFYFSATDRKPRRNEYKYMTQGITAVGDLRVTFTILTNDGQEQVVKDALAMLSGARQQKDQGR